MASSLQELFAQPKVSITQLTPAISETSPIVPDAAALSTKPPPLTEEELKAREDRTIFAGNLPLDTKKKHLLQFFKPCGEIEAVRFRSIPTLESKLPKRAAVILKQVCFIFIYHQ